MATPKVTCWLDAAGRREVSSGEEMIGFDWKITWAAMIAGWVTGAALEISILARSLRVSAREVAGVVVQANIVAKLMALPLTVFVLG